MSMSRRQSREAKSKKRQKQLQRRREQWEWVLPQDKGYASQPSSEDEPLPPLGQNLKLVSYNIVYDAMDGVTSDDFIQSLDEDTKNSLHDALSNHPRKAAEDLEAARAKYKNTPMLHNWLYAAYEKMGETEKAKAVAEDNCRLHPDYLFGRLNYAQIQLDRNDLDKAKEIMEDKWELSLHHPDREAFHITEFMAFYYIAFEYWRLRGDLKRAKGFLMAMKKVEPDSDQVLKAEMSLKMERSGRSLDDVLKIMQKMARKR